MTTEIEKYRIPLFDGTNFSNWKFRIETLLEELELLPFVQENYLTKVEFTDGETATQRAAKETRLAELAKQDRKSLRRLRASNQVEEDIDEMRAEERAQHAEATISMMELICSPTLRSPLIIGVVMQLSQQLSGINAVFYYSTDLFKNSGLTEESAKFATIGIGAIMVGMTLVSIPLMDRTGRRTLHLYGLGGMFIFSIFITISFLIKEMIDWMSYLSVVSTLSFVVFFAVGPGSIPWMITAELFSQGPRPAAMSIAVLVNWMANFVVGIGFPSMQNALENYTFLPFSVFLAIFWTFTYKKVPETKNKTFEEILALFRHGNGRDDGSVNASRETFVKIDEDAASKSSLPLKTTAVPTYNAGGGC